MIRQEVEENFGHEAVEEIDRYMAGRGSNVILVYADDYTFEVLGGVVTNQSLTIDSMIELIGIDMDEFAAWKGWDGWDYDSLIMISTNQWKPLPDPFEEYGRRYLGGDYVGRDN